MSGSQPGLGAAHASSRSAILDLIRAAGTISRVELTRATGLTAATISTVVRRLIDDGLVLEVGRAESTGGKPRMLLQLDPSARYAIGVHLDHAGITYVIANLGGAIVARWRRPGAGSDDPREVVARIAAEIRTTITRVGVDPAGSSGSASSRPGPSPRPTGMTLTPPVMQRWAEFPLGAALEDAVGLPVLLDNDATAAAIGEYWSGGIATGVGVRRALHGHRHRRRDHRRRHRLPRVQLERRRDRAHLRRPRRPVCWCGNIGCVEVLAGPAAVVAAARDAGPRAARPRTSRRTSGRSRAPPAAARPCPLQLLAAVVALPRRRGADARQRARPRARHPHRTGVRARGLAVPARDRASARAVVLRPRQPPRAGDHLLERARGRRRRCRRARAAERAGAAAGRACGCRWSSRSRSPPG